MFPQARYLIFLSFFTLSLYSADFLIVRNGKPNATIVISREINHSTAFAVWDLNYHIQKITGTRLPIAYEDERVRGNRILIGDSKATRKLGIKTENLKEQEYIIRFYPDTLVLLGKDEKIPFTDNIRLFGDVGWGEGKFGKALFFSGKGALCVDDFNFSDEEGSFELWAYLEEKPQEGGEGTLIRLDGANPWSYHIIARVERNR
ncbi:MAG: hypothetical protein ACPLPS_10895, partial [bacterium]